ncbi:MAG: efflux RND transporter periplasmic adaptor subunit, partial [Ruminococcus bromii]|nr:efflux RND transporter periplasmic adaptor subunit [Ruminococcus bromii]
SKAELELENATVISTVNGTVKTLTDLDSALFSGTPFLVVSGGDGFYVTGTLNESLLGRIHVGDYITASSWETGMSYSAEIVKISDFPLDSNNYYYDGSSNPNTSNYMFTAFIQDAEGLQNGMWLDIILQAGAEDDVPSDTFYLSKAYIRSDDVGRYVLKVGSDKRVHKEYVQTGKTVYNEYLEIKSDNLTQDDYVAFPYGTAAIEGAKANLPEDVEIGGEEDIEQ